VVDGIQRMKVGALVHDTGAAPAQTAPAPTSTP